LPFSKALVSIAFVGLILVSIFSFFQKKENSPSSKLLGLPVLLFFALAISVCYSSHFSKGGEILLSQIEFIALPFIFFSNQTIIRERFNTYLNVLIVATTLAAFLTFLFFLLPSQLVQTIAEILPFLKDYVVHEKEMAFGVYSPFTERLQFSYLIGVVIFVLFWQLSRNVNNPPPDPLQRGIAFVQGNSRESKDYFSFFNKKYILFSQAITLIVTLLILGARGAQISFLIVSIVWLIGAYFKFIHTKLVKRFNAFFSYRILVAILFFCLIIIPFFAYKSIPAVKVRYDQMKWEIGTFQDGTYKTYDYVHFTSIRRFFSWKNSWEMIQENPILGVGVGDYQTEMEKQYVKDDLGFPVNTQSQYLYYWASSGLLGVGAFLFLIGYSFFYFLKRDDFPLKLLGISFLVFYSFIFLFDAPLNFQVGAMTFLVFYGLLISKESNTTF